MNRLEFKGDIVYFASNTTVSADGSSQRINEAFVAKTKLAWFVSIRALQFKS